MDNGGGKVVVALNVLVVIVAALVAGVPQQHSKHRLSNNNAPKADPTAVVDPVGTWTYTVESPQGGGGTIVIKKEGEAYSGTRLTTGSIMRTN